MERLCMLPKGRKCMILITLHLEEFLNLETIPQEENEARKVQHLTE